VTAPGVSVNSYTPVDPVAVRQQLSSIRGLLVLSMVMTRYENEDSIVHLATTAVPSFGRCRLEGVYLDDAWRGDGAPALLPQLAELTSLGGGLRHPDWPWTWAYPLDAPGGVRGFLVIGADVQPSEHEQFLLRVLAQQAGVAVANARLHARERAHSEELRATNLALTRSMAIHQRFTRIALAGEGPDGIAAAVHELTGHPVAVEDRYGNLLAWAGPDRLDPYPRLATAQRDALLDRATRADEPLRADGRLLVALQQGNRVFGVLAIVDPGNLAGVLERVTLEHAGTVLTAELAQLAAEGQATLRLQQELVVGLLTGADETTVLRCAHALGYDLGRPHRVVVAEGSDRSGDDEVFVGAVRRTAAELGVGSVVVAYEGAAVLLCDADTRWPLFRQRTVAALTGGRCRLGIGTQCRHPREFASSHRQARLAVKLQAVCSGTDQVTEYEHLGVYQLLSQCDDPAAVDQLTRRWLQPLLDADARRGSQLVATLAAYLEHGGNYDATARSLSVHRSTLKYRLQRIREVSGYDLTDRDTRFNLQLSCRAWHPQSPLSCQDERTAQRGRYVDRLQGPPW
jgi:sugar diacid utilization regulator